MGFDLSALDNALSDKAEAAEAARKQGWVAPQQYDYISLGSTATVQSEVGNYVQGEQGSDIPQWSAQAAKYEWSDELGDIFPSFPELEKQLFKNELTNRMGAKLNK